ncbi:hypothetical protein [Actinoplanes utahensis]|uniref:Uncharacterized protein n=1 Tax=Actinoplanes utahensis TaxID=1869 RepID=A0A0A6UI53_ACTUT|nr:hypothetical protein [Actinoplanes utahensis]KHD75740.1 hypothetical protein MB27_21230 [Actinoplanes utahensis]GIF34507.1 hypothetical protein Aut01nite_74930 [Actinoplanes utahensis]
MSGNRPPAKGTGTVFVTGYRDGTYKAIWQGGDGDRGAYADTEGTEEEVMRWALSREAANYLIWDAETGSHVPLGG